MAIVMTMIVIVIIALNISNLPFLAPARKERNFRRVAPEIKIALALWHFQRITAKFVVSRCAYCKLRRDFGFFCFVNHLSEGGVNANHNVTCSPMTLDFSRIAKEIALASGFFVEGKEEDVALF